MKKVLIFTVYLVFTFSTFAQQNLNDYKYIVVPEQFTFQKSENQYQINELAKFLLEKQNFQVLYKNAIKPTDFAQNPCLGLQFNLNKESSFLKIKLNFNLVDCQNQIVFSSKEGESREKSFKKAYHKALRDAFKSLNGKYTKYNGANDRNEVAVVSPPSPPVTAKQPKKQVVEQVEVVEEVQEMPTTAHKSQLYKAVQLQNGYTLVNKTTGKSMTLLKTSKNNVYVVQGKDAIVFKENKIWYYERSTLKAHFTKVINIEF